MIPKAFSRNILFLMAGILSSSLLLYGYEFHNRREPQSPPQHQEVGPPTENPRSLSTPARSTKESGTGVLTGRYPLRDPAMEEPSPEVEEAPSILGGINAEDVLTPEMLYALDQKALKQIQKGLRDSWQDVLARIRECAADLSEERHPGDTIEVILSVSSRNGLGSIQEVKAIDSTQGFREDTRGVSRCYARAYEGIKFTTDHDYDYHYKMGIVLQ